MGRHFRLLTKGSGNSGGRARAHMEGKLDVEGTCVFTHREAELEARKIHQKQQAVADMCGLSRGQG